MAGLRHKTNYGPRQPQARRQFITVADSEDSGTLWERIEGRVVEKSLVASYSKVSDIDQCWLFTRIFQQPKYIQASTLQLASLRFLQAIGVQGHIKVLQGSPDRNAA